MTMNTEGFEQLFKMKNLSPLGDLGKTSTDIFHRITQQNLELISGNLSRISEHLKRLGNIKKPEDLLLLQKDFINENLTAAIENTQKIIHLTMENMEEFTKLCGSLRETAASTAKEAIKKAEKETR
jgi:hypothetical protein